MRAGGTGVEVGVDVIVGVRLGVSVGGRVTVGVGVGGKSGGSFPQAERRPAESRRMTARRAIERPAHSVVENIGKS